MRTFKVSSFILALNGRITRPPSEKNLSTGTDEAKTPNISQAIFAIVGNVASFTFHHSKIGTFVDTLGAA